MSEINYFYKEHRVSLVIREMQGCCGICIGSGFAVINSINGNPITEQTYNSWDHIDFIKTFEAAVLDWVENQGYTRIYISDVVPDKVKNLSDAYYHASARHNKSINLYTMLKDLEWKGAGKQFVNKRTTNTVKVFYHDVP